MPSSYDAVVIGAGLNGLTTAAYLTRAGRRVLVLERRDVIGGAAATEEFAEAPGFKFDTVTHNAAGLDPLIVRRLDLERFGLQLVQAEPGVFAPLPDGRGLTLWRDAAKTIESIRQFSQADAPRWQAFARRVARWSKFLAELHATTPPRMAIIHPENLWSLGLLGLELRGLGKTEMFELLRALPMPVADWLDEWFESEPLKGALAASGIRGLRLGPRGGGTTYNLLRNSADGVGATTYVRGGMAQLARALAEAVRAHGGEVRASAEVAQIIVSDGQARGVLLASGEEIYARGIASSADPRRTFLGLIDPLHLAPTFLARVRHIRFRGAVAKVNLALGELPAFKGASAEQLRGAIVISPNIDYLERAYDDAKYGGVSRQPYLEIQIPSLMDPSRAPAGKHVMSVWVQYVPYDSKPENAQSLKEYVGNLVVETLAQYAPNMNAAIEYRQVLTPCDLAETYGLCEGDLNHGQVALDQFFFMRPVQGWAQYRTPIAGLYLCGAGTHPGGLPCAAGRNAARAILSK